LDLNNVTQKAQLSDTHVSLQCISDPSYNEPISSLAAAGLSTIFSLGNVESCRNSWCVSLVTQPNSVLSSKAACPRNLCRWSMGVNGNWGHNSHYL